jgi:hypothetical protein
MSELVTLRCTYLLDEAGWEPLLIRVGSDWNGGNCFGQKKRERKTSQCYVSSGSYHDNVSTFRKRIDGHGSTRKCLSSTRFSFFTMFQPGIALVGREYEGVGMDRMKMKM